MDNGDLCRRDRPTPDADNMRRPGQVLMEFSTGSGGASNWNAGFCKLVQATFRSASLKETGLTEIMSPVMLLMGGSFFATVTLAAIVLMAAGTDVQGVHTALRATARFSFLLFWPAYSSRALVSLFGSIFNPLRQRAREFGLAFAAAQLVHLGLVAWLCMIGSAPSKQTFLVFGTAAACVYLLALCTINSLHQFLGTKGWRFLRAIAMNYIAYAFAIDFLRNPLVIDTKHAVLYWPFAALAIIGPGFRFAAMTQRAARRYGHISYRNG
jgi:hypothetical protein